MRLPFVSRKELEHQLHYQAQRLAGLTMVNHGNGLTNGLELVEHWLTDSRDKAIELAKPRLEEASIDWIDGFHFGQEWVVQAMEDLARNIEQRKGAHAATHSE